MTLRVRFQPIIDVRTASILGYESTMLGPQNENALVLFSRSRNKLDLVELDRRAILLALERGLPLLRGDQKLFINLHEETVRRGLPLEIIQKLDKVVLEITEKVDLSEDTKPVIEYLTDKGANFAVDDYGKQNSNIDRLTIDWFRPRYLKLDREFTSKINQKHVLSVIKHTISLCSDLNIKLIVEGIETQEQQNILMEQGVQYMQGYYLGMPSEAPMVGLNYCEKFA